jgi:U3 small nucleolar RNA-associated protein 11
LSGELLIISSKESLLPPTYTSQFKNKNIIFKFAENVFVEKCLEGTSKDAPGAAPARQHLGILEKKKDYKKRATNFQDKQATIKALRKRALNKNPDEFYHHMINSKVQDGQHFEVEKPLEDEDSAAQEKLMNSQDVRYISMKRISEANKLQRLQAELHMIDSAEKVPNSHMFFVDNKKEAKRFNLAKRLDTHPSLICRKSNRPTMRLLRSKALPTLNESEIKILTAEKSKRYSELNKRVERAQELRVVEQKLMMKKHLLTDKEKHEKVLAGTKKVAPVYRWKYERKR